MIILNKRETLPAIRSNKNVFFQVFRTREVSFDGLLPDLFREQRTVSCSPITFINIQIRTFTVLYSLS